MSKPLHVLLSAYACLPNAGTEPGHGWTWATHLAERGIRVHVLTVTDGQEQIDAYRAEHPNPLISFSYVRVPAMFPHPGPLHYAWWQWAAVPLARALHRAEPFDIVHHVTYGSIHVPTQLWRLGVPTIFGPVGGGQVTPANMLSEFGSARRAEMLRTAFTRFLPYSLWHRAWLRRMTLVLAANTDTMRLVKRMGKAEVEPWFDTILPLSFFAEAPRTFAPSSAPLRLLWVGRMLPRKALPMTLDALALVQQPFTLTIAGSGLPEALVRTMIAARGLTGRVFWAGRRLSHSEVRQAYNEHDALLLASLRDTGPVQLVEAMGLGLPVITLDHHGARDLVPHGAGIKIPVTSRQGIVCDLAAAVERFHQLSAEEKSAMSLIGWSFARGFNCSAGAELLEALYREILAGAPILTSFPGIARHVGAAAVAQ